MATFTVEIPDQLLSEIEQIGQPIQAVIVQAVEAYVLKNHRSSVMQTQTWQLCGTLQVAKPDAQAIVGQDDQGNLITNYAEQVDTFLY